MPLAQFQNALAYLHFGQIANFNYDVFPAKAEAQIMWLSSSLETLQQSFRTQRKMGLEPIEWLIHIVHYGSPNTTKSQQDGGLI